MKTLEILYYKILDFTLKTIKIIRSYAKIIFNY